MNFVDNARKASGLSTVQIDVENGETFDLSFTDEDGKKKRPIILHTSISGAVERVIYALLELQAMHIKEGTTPQFPTWLSPTQVRIIPLSEKQNDYCVKLLGLLKHAKIRADYDDRQETMQKKVRDSEREWVPYVAVVGEKEEGSGKLSVRIRRGGKSANLTVEELSALVRNECGSKPFEKLLLQDRLSMRPIF